MQPRFTPCCRHRNKRLTFTFFLSPGPFPSPAPLSHFLPIPRATSLNSRNRVLTSPPPSAHRQYHHCYHHYHLLPPPPAPLSASPSPFEDAKSREDPPKFELSSGRPHMTVIAHVAVVLGGDSRLISSCLVSSRS